MNRDRVEQQDDRFRERQLEQEEARDQRREYRPPAVRSPEDQQALVACQRAGEAGEAEPRLKAAAAGGPRALRLCPLQRGAASAARSRAQIAASSATTPSGAGGSARGRDREGRASNATELVAARAGPRSVERAGAECPEHTRMAVDHRRVDELEALETCMAGHRVQACGGEAPVDEVITGIDLSRRGDVNGRRNRKLRSAAPWVSSSTRPPAARRRRMIFSRPSGLSTRCRIPKQRMRSNVSPSSSRSNASMRW